MADDLTQATTSRKARWRPSRNLLALSLVSFLTDASSEIIAPLLPLFLVGTLGASVAFVGIIEGTAESVASLLKLVSGWWSDRLGRRKPLILAGYGLASVMRPLMALATTPLEVLGIRVADRVGKGVRASPRDALLAASVAPEERGKAYGFHRASDHAGAVVGPIIAIVCLQVLHMPLRQVFWVAAVPGVLSVLVVLFAVREAPQGAPLSAPPPPPPPLASPMPAQVPFPDAFAGRQRSDGQPASLGVPFRNSMVAVLVFTLGNSTDAFLLLRANQLGVPVAAIPLLWLVLHLVKMLSSPPGGSLSDRFGRRPLIVSGWLLYAVVYAGFAMASKPWHVWALFAVYGVVFGLTEGNQKALVADLAPAERRGVAFGWYHAAIGVAALPASVLFGVLWDRFGVSTAFGAGSAIALVATAVLLLATPRSVRPASPEP